MELFMEGMRKKRRKLKPKLLFVGTHSIHNEIA